MTRGDYYRLPHPDWKVDIKSTYTPQYSAGGPDGIINGVRGDEEWRKGEWQGYQGQDFEVVVDMGSEKSLRRFGAGFLQDTRAWILMPKDVTFYVSTDNINFTEVAKIDHNVADRDMNPQTHDLEKEVSPVKARYVKVKATNYGDLPGWHLGAGYPAYIFVDELILE
jgi:hypothetical protein